MHFRDWKVLYFIKISLKFVPKGLIDNNPALVQIMAWRRTDDKPLSEPMIIDLPTLICVTRPQWIKEAPRIIGMIVWNDVPSTAALVSKIMIVNWMRLWQPLEEYTRESTYDMFFQIILWK